MANKQVLLAETWDESIDPTGYWISEKLDGVRAYWNGKTFYSRQGNQYMAPSWFTKDLPNSPLDGELWCGRGLFQKCVSIVKKQKNCVDDDWKFVTYLIFDAPTFDGTYEERVDYLNKTITVEKQTTYAAVVGIRKCTGTEHLKKCLDEVNKLGGEGIMLRKPGSKYIKGRSEVLLKVKTFHDDEAKVTGHKRGEGRLSGMMGGLECVLANGVTFTVGTGFSDAQRKKPPKVGSVITFKFQELSNSGTPRFPVFLRIRTDMTWEDVLENAKTKISPALKQKIIPQLKKQHSILFSTVPSRDQETGKKIVTSDDVDESVEEEEKEIEKKKQDCKFGANCYRTDPTHLSTFNHPSKESPKLPKKDDKTQKYPCKFGVKCYLTNPLHVAKYSHPDPSEIKEEDLIKEEKEIEELKEETNLLAEEDPQTVTVAISEWKEMNTKLQAQEDRLAKLEELLMKQNSPIVEKKEEKKEEKIVDKMEMEEEENKLPDCMYGEKCTRNNPEHFKKFSHPNANKKRKMDD